MANRVRRLSSRMLKRMILEEAKKLQTETLEQGKEDSEKVDAEETDADKLAGSIEKDIDYMKALKIHENRLMGKIKQIQEARRVLKRRIAKRI